jgi:hypothetical protein
MEIILEAVVNVQKIFNIITCNSSFKLIGNIIGVTTNENIDSVKPIKKFPIHLLLQLMPNTINKYRIIFIRNIE